MASKSQKHLRPKKVEPVPLVYRAMTVLEQLSMLCAYAEQSGVHSNIVGELHTNIRHWIGNAKPKKARKP